MTIYADLRDDKFQDNDGAMFMWGMDGQPHMHETGGFGYSTAARSVKVVVRDGLVYIPDQDYARSTPKPERDYSHYPMAIARIQPNTKHLSEVAVAYGRAYCPRTAPKGWATRYG